MTPAQNPPPNRLIASVGVQCHPGSVRTENQDRISRASTSFGDLYVVADGVGGYQCGAEAAQATVDGFAQGMHANATLSRNDALTVTAQNINHELEARGQSQDPPVKMSSTVVVALIHGSTATVAHVGDSRAYLVRNRQLQQITRDHSVVQRLIDQGMVTPAQAVEHPSAGVLTQALGQSADIHLEISDVNLRPGDALLLCSDGLWGYANEAEIETVVTSENLSPSACAEALLNLALQGGGGDNISIQFLRFSAPATVIAPRRILGMAPRVAVLAGAFAVLTAAGVELYLHTPHPHAESVTAPATPVVTVPEKPAARKHSSSAASAAPKPSAKTEIVFIRDDGRQADGASKLSKDYKKIAFIKAEAACLNWEQEQVSIFYKSQAQADAERVQAKLDLPPASLIELEPGKNDCGPGDLFILPAKRSALETIEQKTRKAAKQLPKFGDKQIP